VSTSFFLFLEGHESMLHTLKPSKTKKMDLYSPAPQNPLNKTRKKHVPTPAPPKMLDLNSETLI
jgi:hypothetical protein